MKMQRHKVPYGKVACLEKYNSQFYGANITDSMGACVMSNMFMYIIRKCGCLPYNIVDRSIEISGEGKLFLFTILNWLFNELYLITLINSTIDVRYRVHISETWKMCEEVHIGHVCGEWWMQSAVSFFGIRPDGWVKYFANNLEINFNVFKLFNIQN
jgi:hypothetical protein